MTWRFKNVDRWRSLKPTVRDRLMESEPFGSIPEDLVEDVKRAGLPFAPEVAWETDPPGPGRQFLREDFQHWMTGISSSFLLDASLTEDPDGLAADWTTTDVGFAEESVLWSATVYIDDENLPLYQLGVKLVKSSNREDIHSYVRDHQAARQFNIPPANRAVELGLTKTRAYFPRKMLPKLPSQYRWNATLNVDGIDVARSCE